jgi:hypothetical protein
MTSTLLRRWRETPESRAMKSAKYTRLGNARKGGSSGSLDGWRLRPRALRRTVPLEVSLWRFAPFRACKAAVDGMKRAVRLPSPHRQLRGSAASLRATFRTEAAVGNPSSQAHSEASAGQTGNAYRPFRVWIPIGYTPDSRLHAAIEDTASKHLRPLYPQHTTLHHARSTLHDGNVRLGIPLQRPRRASRAGERTAKLFPATAPTTRALLRRQANRSALDRLHRRHARRPATPSDARVPASAVSRRTSAAGPLPRRTPVTTVQDGHSATVRSQLDRIKWKRSRGRLSCPPAEKPRNPAP